MALNPARLASLAFLPRPTALLVAALVRMTLAQETPPEGGEAEAGDHCDDWYYDDTDGCHPPTATPHPTRGPCLYWFECPSPTPTPTPTAHEHAAADCRAHAASHAYAWSATDTDRDHKHNPQHW